MRISSQNTSVFDDFYFNSFTLNQNYPNPFNPTTIIDYQISKESQVKLEIYNSLGELITTLIDKYHYVGDYKAYFNALEYNLSSGIYLCRITTDYGANSIKMSYLK